MNKLAFIVAGTVAFLAHGAIAGAQTDTPAPAAPAPAMPTFYALTVQEDNGGGLPANITTSPLGIDGVCVAVTCVHKFLAGTVVQIKLDTTHVREWSWDGACKSASDNICKVTMDADKSAKIIIAPPHHGRN